MSTHEAGSSMWTLHGSDRQKGQPSGVSRSAQLSGSVHDLTGLRNDSRRSLLTGTRIATLLDTDLSPRLVALSIHIVAHQVAGAGTVGGDAIVAVEEAARPEGQATAADAAGQVVSQPLQVRDPPLEAFPPCCRETLPVTLRRRRSVGNAASA